MPRASRAKNLTRRVRGKQAGTAGARLPSGEDGHVFIPKLLFIADTVAAAWQSRWNEQDEVELW